MRWWDVRLLRPHKTDLAAPALAAVTITVHAPALEEAVAEAMRHLRVPADWRPVKAEELKIEVGE